MNKSTRLENDLIQLLWVEKRLNSIYFEFPKISKDKESDLFKRVIREIIVVQLANFIKIRKHLIEENKIKPVDKCLESLWKPIMKLEKPIFQLRNNYIVHIQEVDKLFKKMPQNIIDKYQVPTSFGDWLFLTGCVCTYCDIIYANFKKDWNSAKMKYEAKMPYPTKYGSISERRYHNFLKTAFQNAQKELNHKGFKSSRKSK